ncbi:MAG: GNAT family N-acetyltransferase [Cyanobacteriota bacterium]|nr:GNAT family N-acetyltransferase [Cyanobacteriota bacterium]
MKVEAIAQLTEEQIEDLYQLYKSTWWANNRTVPGIRKMLQNTDIAIGLCEVESKKLVAFGRVLTDYFYRAVIWDLIVEESYRGQGLGKALMEAIVNHPSLKEVESMSLMCFPEMVPFYEKFGFTQFDIEFMLRVGER